MKIVIFIIVYFILLAINIFLIHRNERVSRGLTMFADPRNGFALNAFIFATIFVPPVLYIILLVQLYSDIQNWLRY
jgi:hypothetical protein